MTRFRAAGIHLSLSLCTGLLAFLLIYLVWYPPPLFVAMGGNELAMLLIGIDVVLGPLLTFLVFKSGKRGMKFDLYAIGTMQFLALCYGTWIIAQARPAFIVSRGDIAYVVTANEIRSEELAQAKVPEFGRLSWTGPVYAGVHRPTTPEELRAVSQLNFEQGRDIQQVPSYYRPWSELREANAAGSEPLEDLLARKPFYQAEADAWLAARGRAAKDLRYIALLTRTRELAMVIDAASGELVGIMPIDGS